MGVGADLAADWYESKDAYDAGREADYLSVLEEVAEDLANETGEPFDARELLRKAVLPHGSPPVC
ncbi:MAG TPA: hypothetical protein VGN08_12370 [Solirubrobacteraceae bacterium]|jgi:hypothetical protein